MEPWIVEGKIHPEIGHVLPMEQAGEAHRLMLERSNYGKIVLRIGS
jgi:NADPH:quinone reductase-like Zn-dependent oxidoreductase